MTDGYQAQENRIFGLNPISRLNDAFAYDPNIPSADLNSSADESAATQSVAGFPRLSSYVVRFGSNKSPVYHTQSVEDVSQPINQVRPSTYLSHDIDPDTIPVHPQFVSDVRPRTTVDGQVSDWNSLAENVTPSNVNVPAPQPQPGRPLGIVFGEPMPQRVVPPPIFGFPDDAGTQGNGPRNRSQSRGSMFDTGTPPVPFVSPSAWPSVGQRATLGNGPAVGFSATGGGNLANIASQAPASPVLQYLQNLRQQGGGNSPQQFLTPPSGPPATLVPADPSGAPIGGLLARLMAVAGIDPDGQLESDDSRQSWFPWGR